jgi:hypothetical protein
MNRSKRRLVQFGTVVLAAGAMGVWGAAGATSNNYDPATDGCVPAVPGGNLGKALEDVECLLQEAGFRLNPPE